jgi:hypothetical protein
MRGWHCREVTMGPVWRAALRGHGSDDLWLCGLIPAIRRNSLPPQRGYSVTCTE